MLDPALQTALRERPIGRAAMRQSWRDLAFLHFPCDPAEIAALLPPGLTVDTFPDEDGIERAWVGLVPFMMKDVRWAFAPRVPGTHTFLETNVRTYVHCEGRDPGVWFFSLDATNALAVSIARAAFSLPYFHAALSLAHTQNRIRYAGHRDLDGLTYLIDAIIGGTRAAPEPGSLEFFLVERYVLYTVRRGRLFSGRVFHVPYRLREISIERGEEGLVAAARIAPRPFTHAVFSPGVDVEVFPLRAVVRSDAPQVP